MTTGTDSRSVETASIAGIKLRQVKLDLWFLYTHSGFCEVFHSPKYHLRTELRLVGCILDAYCSNYDYFFVNNTDET